MLGVPSVEPTGVACETTRFCMLRALRFEFPAMSSGNIFGEAVLGFEVGAWKMLCQRFTVLGSGWQLALQVGVFCFSNDRHIISAETDGGIRTMVHRKNMNICWR